MFQNAPRRHSREKKNTSGPTRLINDPVRHVSDHVVRAVREEVMEHAVHLLKLPAGVRVQFEKRFVRGDGRDGVDTTRRDKKNFWPAG